MKKINKILIANRGEIAVRVMRTAKRMGIGTVAIYSEPDRRSLHVSEADEAILIEGLELNETYLNITKIVEIARRLGCDAIHPGYGFLAENPIFVEACEQAGITFIGPGSDVMSTMGNKIAAREFVKKAGVPITEGLTGSKETLLRAKDRVGFPVLLKAAAGGGGKGMQIVREEKELKEALESTSRQALAYFGDGTIYIERYLDEPRHIEIQILGDSSGNVIHLFERECSIQRRYQKIIEESPSPTLTPELRSKMGAAAVRIGKEIGYTNAGTIEFLVDKNLNFYFLEMNTRIQVEHPVTEMVTGTDIVEEQILIAEGYPLRLKQEDVIQKGHAIECRIYAEDPENNFRPSPGQMSLYSEPELDHIRIDKGISEEAEINSSFDPMICKLISYGDNREEARLRMIEALRGYTIHGIRTNILFLSELLRSNAFISNSISTKFCDEHLTDLISQLQKRYKEIKTEIPVMGFLIMTFGIRESKPQTEPGDDNIWNRTGFWREEEVVRINVDGKEHSIKILGSKYPNFQFMSGDESYRAEVKSKGKASLDYKISRHQYRIYFSKKINGSWSISYEGHIFEMKRLDFLPESITPVRFELDGHSSDVYSPMPGKVIKLVVNKGDKVKKGDLLVIVEAMKMENSIVSPTSGLVSAINVAINDRIDPGKALINIEKEEN